MSGLEQLARAAGVSRVWEDAEGRDQIVARDTLVAILEALGHSAATEVACRSSIAAIAAEEAQPPVFLSADVGRPVALPSSLAGATRAELFTANDSGTELTVEGGRLPGMDQTGYHRLLIEGHELTLAVAPRSCPRLTSLGRKRWGVAVQIPALRGTAGTAFGTLDDLSGAMAPLALAGADAVAISPVHALFPGDGARFSPYAPSSRLFLNTALAQAVPSESSGPLVDWCAGLPHAYTLQREAFAALTREDRAELAAWARTQPAELSRHALFDALSAHLGCADWRKWPVAFHDPEGGAARTFRTTNEEAVALCLFLQRRALNGLEAAQRAAGSSGMAIGLIADLAVGVDPGGSDAWALQHGVLRGLTIGAPPDPLGPLGQNWGLTSFSPRGLKAGGFAPFIAMLRAALVHAGGVRIDHAFGLDRLWVIPAGGAGGDGAYLSLPFADLVRLVLLEAGRANAFVIAEDLGTRPPGFADAIADKGMAGMRVLWFEREEGGGFAAAERYDVESVAMTGTHDTPTVAGWWRGTDLAWNERLGRASPDARSARAFDREALWSTLGDGSPAPEVDDPEPVIDAALAHVGGAASQLAIVPMEDVLAMEEQPNLPGTIDEHPNWRRRLPATMAVLLADPMVVHRLAILDRSRTA